MISACNGTLYPFENDKATGTLLMVAALCISFGFCGELIYIWLILHSFFLTYNPFNKNWIPSCRWCEKDHLIFHAISIQLKCCVEEEQIMEKLIEHSICKPHLKLLKPILIILWMPCIVN